MVDSYDDNNHSPKAHTLFPTLLHMQSLFPLMACPHFRTSSYYCSNWLVFLLFRVSINEQGGLVMVYYFEITKSQMILEP